MPHSPPHSVSRRRIRDLKGRVGWRGGGGWESGTGKGNGAFKSTTLKGTELTATFSQARTDYKVLINCFGWHDFQTINPFVCHVS